jgi:hypothetical protein
VRYWAADGRFNLQRPEKPPQRDVRSAPLLCRDSDEYVTLNADFWDGLGVDPAFNLIPAGKILAGSVRAVATTPGVMEHQSVS